MPSLPAAWRSFNEMFPAMNEIRLDVRGLNCPLPALRTERMLATMAPGMRLRVEATDPMAAIDIPHYVRQNGHRMIETLKEERRLVFVIEKGAPQIGQTLMPPEAG